jgi:hypothetical protein
MLPPSEKRLRANRANAARSTGPVTDAGKARVAGNATRHGLLAAQILIGNESAENFKTLCDIIVRRFEPVDGFEYSLVEELAASYWRLRRAWALETEMFENAMEKQTARRQLARMDAAFGELASQPKLPLLYRYEGRLHLMYQRALKNLLLLRGLPPRPDLPNKPITSIPCNESPEPTPSKPPRNADFPDVSSPQTASLLTLPPCRPDPVQVADETSGPATAAASPEPTVHDQRIDFAQAGMLEGFRQTPHSLKAQAVPQPHGPLIGAHHEVELHGPKTALPRPLDRVKAHRPRNPASLRAARGHISAVGHVASSAPLIGLEKIRAYHLARVLRDPHLVPFRKPVGERLVAIPVARHCIGFPGANHRFKYRPDAIAVRLGGSTA